MPTIQRNAVLKHLRQLEEAGLVVPVLRDVQSRDLFTTAEGLNDLVSRAREGRLAPADVRGGTFTISNHGVSGSLVATPIVINQPQSAILGVGKLERRPVVMEDGGEERIEIRPRCYVTLTIDHRVMDGATVARALRRLEEVLTGPITDELREVWLPDYARADDARRAALLVSTARVGVPG